MIGLFSHDAGGAEILSSYVRRRNLDCLFCVDGPALSVFERKLGKIAITTLHNAVEECDWLLCGTSFPADLELRARDLGKKKGKRVIAFLDHWVNYEIRFEREGILKLPDEIWVGDIAAAKIAKQVFNTIPVRVKSNPYFADIREDLRNTRRRMPLSSGGIKVLYVCEDLRRMGKFADSYTERDALVYFFERIADLPEPVTHITLRPHPSEEMEKYDWVAEYWRNVKVRKHMVVIDKSTSLLEQVISHDWIAGGNSTALVVGVLAKKRVMSFIPKNGRPCVLPFEEIERF